MKTRFSVKNHLSHAFLLYIGAVGLTVLACSYAVMLKTRPKAYERFSFFLEGEYVNSGLFQEEMLKVLPEDLVVDLYSMESSDRTFNTYFSAYGLKSDICLLSKTTLDKFKTIEFLNMKDTAWDLPDNYIFHDTYSIGVHAHTKDGEELNNYFTFESDDYYLLVLRTSVHLKGLAKGGQTDQVNRVLEYLTTYE